MTKANGASLELRGLAPSPEEEWDVLRRFLMLGDEDLEAMVATVEILFRRGPELVVGNYDYLERFPETAAILGWERGADPDHLEERRRFMTIWVARTLSLDLGHDFARYLFWAGKKHAGHGPRRVHVDPLYVTGAVSLVQASFADYLSAEMRDAAALARALIGWNKYLTLQLHMMLSGYRAAVALGDGSQPVRVALFGRLRPLLGVNGLTVRASQGAGVAEVLRKFFDYFPEAREEALVWDWAAPDGNGGATWLSELERVYRPRRYWNVLLNGKDLRFYGGFSAPVAEGDEIALFPPGR